MTEETERRIATLEEKFEEMYIMLKQIKNTLDGFTDASEKIVAPTQPPKTTSTARVIASPFAGTYEKGPNPWALKSAQNIFTFDIGKSIIDGAFTTYKPTIDALKSNNNGLTATAVSNITGRARNTEVSYLKKLQRAGFAKRSQSDGKAIYQLINEERLVEVFGLR